MKHNLNVSLWFWLTHLYVLVEEVQPVELFQLEVLLPPLERKVGLLAAVGDLVPVNVDAKASEPVVEFTENLGGN